MSSNTHIELRGNFFWYRRKIPLEFLSAYKGKKEIRHSLRTSDRAAAKRLARVRSVELDAEFERHRHNQQSTSILGPAVRDLVLSDEQIHRVCLLWQRSVLETDDKHRQDGFEEIDNDELSDNLADVEPALRQAL